MKIKTVLIFLISIMYFTTVNAETEESICSNIMNADVLNENGNDTDALVLKLRHAKKIVVNNNTHTIEYRINTRLEPDCLFGVYSSLFISSMKHESTPNKEQIDYAIKVNNDVFTKIILYSIKNLPYYADYFGAGVNLRRVIQKDLLNNVGISLLAEYIKNPLSHESYRIQRILKLDLVYQFPQEITGDLERTLSYFLSDKSGTVRLDVDAAIASFILLHKGGTRYNNEKLSWLFRQLELDFSYYDAEESVFFELGLTSEKVQEKAKNKLSEFIAIYSAAASPQHIKYPIFWESI